MMLSAGILPAILFASFHHEPVRDVDCIDCSHHIPYVGIRNPGRNFTVKLEMPLF